LIAFFEENGVLDIPYALSGEEWSPMKPKVVAVGLSPAEMALFQWVKATAPVGSNRSNSSDNTRLPV